MEARTFIQVFIKSESDLPKEKDKYFVKLKHGIRTVCNFHSRNHKIWLEKVDWYLEPLPDKDNRDKSVILESPNPVLCPYCGFKLKG